MKEAQRRAEASSGADPASSLPVCMGEGAHGNSQNLVLSGKDPILPINLYFSTHLILHSIADFDYCLVILSTS